jgi:hypothetical protein
MEELTVFVVSATYTNKRGEPLTRAARIFPTIDEAKEWYAKLRDSFAAAQAAGLVKHFTMHLSEKHLEPSKKEA